jgi:hypothetical protein
MQLHALPERLVQLLSRWWVRSFIIAAVSVVMILGATFWTPLQQNLDVGVQPPKDSESGKAKDQFEANFDPDPVQLILMVSSRDGLPLLNTSLVYNHSFTEYRQHYLDESQTPLTPAAKEVSHELRAMARWLLDGKCEYSFVSYWDIFNDTDSRAQVQRLETFVEEGILGHVFSGQLFNQCTPDQAETGCVDASSTLMLTTLKSCEGHFLAPNCVTAGKSWCDPLKQISDDVKDYARARTGQGELKLEVLSFVDIYSAAEGGVDGTMRVSTMSAPIAFLFLGGMLRNLRQLLITLLNILATLTAAILVMYPITCHEMVSSQAPAMMMAVALAMTIDYSLFLLTRFNLEVHTRGRPVREAVVTMLETSGHTVLVSGTTLCLCFLGMLLIPVTTIGSMGLAAGFTVLFAISLSLVFTPTLLLSFPHFFTANRRFGLTLDGCGCRSLRRWSPLRPPDSPATASHHLSEGLVQAGTPTSLNATLSPAVRDGKLPPAQDSFGEPKGGAARRGLWSAIGAKMQRPWLAALFLLGCFACAVPFALPLFHMRYVEGVLSLLPRGETTTASFTHVQDTFGVSNVFTNTLFVLTPDANATRRPEWLDASCHALQELADDATATLADEGCTLEGAPCVVRREDFSGVMIAGGLCFNTKLDAVAQWIETSAWVKAACAKLPVPLEQCTHAGDAAEEVLRSLYGNDAQSATRVRVSTKLDPFSVQGQQWIRAIRGALKDKGTVTLHGKRVVVGDWCGPLALPPPPAPCRTLPR